MKETDSSAKRIISRSIESCAELEWDSTNSHFKGTVERVADDRWLLWTDIPHPWDQSKRRNLWLSDTRTQSYCEKVLTQYPNQAPFPTEQLKAEGLVDVWIPNHMRTLYVWEDWKAFFRIYGNNDLC